MLHIRDVEGPKKTKSMETRFEAMEQQVFKCQGMVERGLNANHMILTEFTNNHKMDAIDIGKHLSRLYDRVDQLQGQIYDLQNQNWHAGLTSCDWPMSLQERRGRVGWGVLSWSMGGDGRLTGWWRRWAWPAAGPCEALVGAAHETVNVAGSVSGSIQIARGDGSK
ncbi:40s ribosomal protein s5-1 [Hordeum vulgare]|nr:40s ribosomal protein s5-1 [Hordeum vulgare]